MVDISVHTFTVIDVSPWMLDPVDPNIKFRHIIVSGGKTPSFRKDYLAIFEEAGGYDVVCRMKWRRRGDGGFSWPGARRKVAGAILRAIKLSGIDPWAQ